MLKCEDLPHVPVGPKRMEKYAKFSSIDHKQDQWSMIITLSWLQNAWYLKSTRQRSFDICLMGPPKWNNIDIEQKLSYQRGI